MGDPRRYISGGSSSEHETNKHIIVPKPEILDYDLPCDTVYSHIGDNVASSSGSNVRSLLIEMGFPLSLIEKVIEEKGENNIDLLLETLIECSDAQKSKSQSSDSLNGLCHEKDTSSFSGTPGFIRPKQEPDVGDEINEKRATLLTMSFPVNFIDFALDKLGKDAPIYELVDFIIAAQVAKKYEEESENSLDDAENYEKEPDDSPNGATQKVEVTDELLFETMDKTLHLLEMGFSDHEVSLAIDKLGSNCQISELADTIFTGEVPGNYPEKDKKSSAAPKTNHACPSKNWRFVGVGTENGSRQTSSSDAVNIKSEDSGLASVSLPMNSSQNLAETWKGKRPKEEDGIGNLDATTTSTHHDFSEYDNQGKRLKPEHMEGSSSILEPAWPKENFGSKSGNAKGIEPGLSRSLEKVLAKPPYFFYGNFANISPHWWSKISQFLYAIHPEFVNTQSFSALSRSEGYLHNLPTESRFHVLSQPLTTIQDALPQTKRWWPSWDNRKHLTSVSSETSRLSRLCDRLGNLLVESRGLLSPQKQKFVLHHCKSSNLLWVAPNILSPTEPEHLERILGYSANHTEAGGISLTERLKLLEHCFQTDTLAYHLSALKHLFPGGLTLLSVFSGIGGAEVALTRLGIHLKGVVSIEPCELSRKVVKKWWQSSGQDGELVQIEGIKSLTTKKLEVLMERFGGFDLIICQNPCTPSNLSKESSRAAVDGKSQPQDFDFMMFNEFVRVLQRVRGMMG